MINLKNYRMVELNNGSFALQLMKRRYLFWKIPTNKFLHLSIYKQTGEIYNTTPDAIGAQADTVEILEQYLQRTAEDCPYDVKREVIRSKLDKVLK